MIGVNDFSGFIAFLSPLQSCRALPHLLAIFANKYSYHQTRNLSLFKELEQETPLHQFIKNQ